MATTNKDSVNNMLNEINMYLDNCKYQAFSSDRIIVQKNELVTMLNELRMKFPSQLERSQKIMNNKDGILAAARHKSDVILQEAELEQRRMVDESEIVTLANIQAEEILRQAENQAREIVAQAQDEANTIRVSMMDYSTTVLSDMQRYMQDILNSERENYENLLDTLQGNVEMLEGNRREMEGEKIDLLRRQQPEVSPEARYSDSAFPQTQGYDDSFAVEEAPEAPVQEEFSEEPAEAVDYDDDDDLFGE